MKVKLEVKFLSRRYLGRADGKWKDFSLEDIYKVFEKVCSIKSWSITEKSKLDVLITMEIEPMPLNEFTEKVRKKFNEYNLPVFSILILQYQVKKGEMKKYSETLFFKRLLKKKRVGK